MRATPTHLAASLVVLLVMAMQAAHVLAQEPKTSVRDIVVAAARVMRIDRSSRSLTLRTNEGADVAVYVGPELKIFDELKTGDNVTVRLTEAVIVAVQPNGRPQPYTDNTAAAKKAGEGERGEVLQQLKATVKVESVDAARQVITYTTADNRHVIRPVIDPHLLDGLKAGDVIAITYSRERAIALERAR